jgi:hypothetical protein
MVRKSPSYLSNSKKCSSGLFCIENATLLILFLILLIILYYVYKISNQSSTRSNTNPNSNPNSRSIIDNIDNNDIGMMMMMMQPQTHTQTQTQDIMNDPYIPPLKENQFYTMLSSSSPFSHPFSHHSRIEGGGVRRRGGLRHGIPINMPTSHYDLEYKQTGILTKPNASGRSEDATILPLFGRPLHSNRNKWQYYTMTDKNAMVKLPISKGGRSCTDQVVGCDELYNGDNVYVEGYGDVFNVTVYENSTPTYIPYL